MMDFEIEVISKETDTVAIYEWVDNHVGKKVYQLPTGCHCMICNKLTYDGLVLSKQTERLFVELVRGGKSFSAVPFMLN